MDNIIPGVRLAPKDSEVVHLFLQRRVQNLPINNCFVFDRENFYATHPQLIPLPPPHFFLDHQESWFFVERTMQGQRVNRLVADNSGRWVGQKKYSIVEGGITIAYKQKLVFKNNQNLNTGWHQIEFSLNSAPVQSLKLVYQEEDDVLHQQLMAQLQQQQLEAQHQMQQLMAQHPLQHLMAQHQLQQLETQHQIQQLMAQHPLQPLMAQHQLQQLEAQHQLQLLEAQHQLQHLMAQHPLQHLMAQHQLQLLEAQHQLQLLEAQQHLQHLQQLEAAQHQLQQPEAQQQPQPQHVEAMVMSDVQVPHNEEEL